MDVTEQSASENAEGEPTTVTAKAKRLIQKHRKKTLAGVGTAAAAMAAIAIKLALEQYLAKNAGDVESVVPNEQSSDFEAWEEEYRTSEPEQRRTVSEHTVQGHPMRISGEASAEGRVNWARAYEAGLVDTPLPPPGWTWRSDSVRGGQR
jgi:septal ring-binding cell division protein DamX